MLPDSDQAIAQFLDTCRAGGVYLVKQPEYAVALDRLIIRKLAKRPVAAQ